jgi:hypothetical protein
MQSVLSGTKLATLVHLLVAMLILLLPLLLLSGTLESTGNFLGRFYLRIGLYSLFFYTCYLYVVPRFYIQGPRWLFGFSILAGTLAIYLIDAYLSQALFPDNEFRILMDAVTKALQQKGMKLKPPSPEFHAIGFTAISLLLAGTALGLRLAQAHSQREKELKELEKQHLATELSLLKNQVSPHFFFNTLNNIYALTEIDTEAAQKSILKLSRLMRYLLYETNTESIPLAREIDFLNDFIDLMRLRITQKVEIHVELPQQPEQLQVPPLLFIPFVENAFKHGISNREPSFIHIKLTASKQVLQFNCVNSIFQVSEPKSAPGGIGLENVRKRLDLLYGPAYTLSTGHQNATYCINLHINLKATEL